MVKFLTSTFPLLLVCASLLFSLYTVVPFIQHALQTSPAVHPSTFYPSFSLPSAISPSPLSTSSLSPLLRSPLSHHHYASLFEKLHRAEPIRIAILGGSLSARDGWHTRHTPQLRYFNSLISWLNSKFPSSPSSLSNATTERLKAFDSLFHDDDTQKTAPLHSHKLLNLAAGGTGTPSTSFCWSSLFTLPSGRLALPDLIFIEYAVNDAFFGLPGAIIQGEDDSNATFPILPISPLHSLDRLVRTILNTSVTHSHPIALFMLYFKAGYRKQHGSTQYAHDRVARHYGIKSISFRDHVLHPLTRQQLLKGPAFEEYGNIYEEDSYHPGGEGHRWMNILIQRSMVELWDNYWNSQRSALVGGWAVAGRVASTSVRMKGREGHEKQRWDDVTTVEEVEIEDSWRVHTDIDSDDISITQWQQKIVKGEESEEFILPPILSLPPLALPPAFHPLNADLPPWFFCRKTYAPYLADAWKLPFSSVADWFGIIQSSPSTLPLTHHLNVSVDLQWQFASTPRHASKSTFSPNPEYLKFHVQPLPSMEIAFPKLLHSFSLFYLRTPHVMATAAVYLYCSQQQEVRSPVMVLNGSWTSPASQVTVSCVYSATASSPKCFDRLHLELQSAAEFHVIGYAVA